MIREEEKSRNRIGGRGWSIGRSVQNVDVFVVRCLVGNNWMFSPSGASAINRDYFSPSLIGSSYGYSDPIFEASN